MPFVHIIMEPRDDETRHRIAREVSDAVADITHNALESVVIIFHELPRPAYAQGLALASRKTAASPGSPQSSRYVSITKMQVADAEAYLGARRDIVNPALAVQQGFISTDLLKLNGQGEYWLLEKWQTKQDAEKWASSDLRRSVEADADRANPGNCRTVSEGGAEYVHQTFGKTGGAVVAGLL